MALTTAGLNAAVEGITDVVTHIALVDETGTELTGGTYARQAVSWAAASVGAQKIAADETFNVPAATTVGGWRGYTALTVGTNIGGEDLDEEAYTNAGTYVLEAATTGYTVANPA